MILYELTENTGIITISSGKGNLIDSQDIKSLSEIIKKSAIDNAVKGIIIKGDNRSFCTGLKAGELDIAESDSFFSDFDKLLLQLFSYPKSLVVALSGHSIGGGLLIQCCADYVVAINSDKIKIGLPELKIRLTVDTLMIALLEYNMPNARCLQKFLYSGDYINVNQAKEFNLIDAVVSSEELIDVSKKTAVMLQDYNVKAFNVTKLGLRNFTIERMKNEFEKDCFTIFGKLNK